MRKKRFFLILYIQLIFLFLFAVYAQAATPTSTPSATATHTITPTPNMTISTTPTTTPAIPITWQDDFIGTAGDQPDGWEDETDYPTFNAELEYSTTYSYAVLTRTTQSTWGKAMSENINLDIYFYSNLRINVVSLSPGMRWRLTMRRAGATEYFDLQPETTELGIQAYTFRDYIDHYEINKDINPLGIENIRLELIVAGNSGAPGFAEIDFIQIYGPEGQPTPTPVPSPPGTLNINYKKNAEGSDIIVFQGKPHVAWSEKNSSAQSPQIYVKRFIGNDLSSVNFSEEWELVGSAIGSKTGSPSLTADADSLYLAYAQYLPDIKAQIKVKKFNGTDWTDLGTAWDGEGNPDIGIWKGVPIVTWANWFPFNSEGNSGVHHVNVSQFTGTQWKLIGKALNQGTTSCVVYPQPKLDVFANTPYVTWFEQWEFNAQDLESYSHVYIKYLPGSEWVQLGSGFYHCREPIIALSSSGVPKVVWQQFKNTKWQAYVRQWNSIQLLWEQEGGALNTEEEAPEYDPDICVMDETLYLVGKETNGKNHEIFLKYRNGLDWIKVSEQVNKNPDREVHDPHITKYINRNNTGHIFLSWCEKSSLDVSQLYVQHYQVEPQTPKPPFDHKVKTYAWPNPFIPVLGQKAVFYFDATQSTQRTIRIISLEGRVVRRLTDTTEWDGRSEDGHLCEGGLYIYQINTGSQRMSGTIVLLK